MNGSMRPRNLLRFWRVGATVGGIVVIALVAVMIVGRHHGTSTTDTIRTSTTTSQPSGIAVVAPTAAAARSAPAGTTAAGNAATGSRPASGSAPSDATTILNAPLPRQVIDQKIIRNGSLSITAKNVAETQDAIWKLASEYGGVVLTSNTSGTDENVRADISFRVPSERFRDAMDRVRGYAVKVEKEQSSAQDVTEDYVDLQARQRTLEATTLQLQTLLGKATTVDETLKVQAQLNNVQSDLERIKGKLNYYDARTAFSTITVSILPVSPTKPEPVTPVAKWSLGHSIHEAWNRSVNGLQNVVDALIAILIGGWWIEIPLVVAIVLLVRRERRRHPALVPVAVSSPVYQPTDRVE
ncbi:MAG: DUF4349 domain-containing protein [Chloroflexota bacterium]|nr:DUF4349 domain-containing protein [Chloroflexota bacterium]